ncbi:DUF192 domain-containing protein [Evansella tamaricis]|uniref:DUF192 domain-containing protein n=1 Tax=Evansella tamaricis TaxID=2069301 RepID=A0ABS6JDM7_9BACI|nr:DUF192 domain-containing protein [Evansella tamaricis]MBU9711588.1 DUF192 domain-containing protein [Evansella tamaricis]
MFLLLSNIKSDNNEHVLIDKYDSFSSRFKGLMFRKIPLENEGIWIIPCNSIHMFFMFISIDVVFINKDLKIIKVFPNVQPWTIIPPVKGAHSALELPIGTIEKFELKPCDQVCLQPM